MIFMYLVLCSALALLLFAGVREQRRHYRNLRSIGTRVLINGVRGKSSITRLVAGALRGGNLRVVAKTTGTAARFIYPDASEEPVYRQFGIANVSEQIGIVARAAAEKPDALVIECMAVQPALQELSQTKLVQSNIGVLCNVREDHLYEMGPTLDDVARSLSRAMPRGGVCITAERERYELLSEEAARRDCELVLVNPEEITDDEMARFSWFAFKENVAIALAVARQVGIDRDSAMTGMWSAPPDPGALTADTYRLSGATLHFANIFAANDPQSTVQDIQELSNRNKIYRPYYVLINCRPDRLERNAQMGEIVAQLDPSAVFLIGHPTKTAKDAIPDSWNGRIINLGGLSRTSDEIWRALVKEATTEADGHASVLAIGNVHGQGEQLLRYLEQLGDLR